MSAFVNFLARLDRRWIFLLMAVSVMIPIILRFSTKELPTDQVRAVFNKVESLPPGSKVLLSFDYDPGSEAELQPMAVAWVWHCARKHHKLYFMGLWPLGPAMIQKTVDDVLKSDYPDYRYGDDYVNLGYKSGNEGVIRVVVSNMGELFTSDVNGQSLKSIPLTRDLTNIRRMDLILNVSAGYPGAKEWVQYAAAPYNIALAAGSTGVQTPNLYPYLPNQMLGLLGAIKGAAEYEALLVQKYPEYGKLATHLKGTERMGPQLIAHLLVLALIVLGNVVLFLQRKAREAA